MAKLEIFLIRKFLVRRLRLHFSRVFYLKKIRYPLRVAMFRINRDCNGYFNKVARCLIKL